MNLKVYFQKIRQLEASIGEPHVVIVSQETPDGGRPGIASEVPRGIAAKMVVEGNARLATPEETEQFRNRMTEAKQVADQASAAQRVQFTVVSESELRALKTKTKS
jgi:hypothetical protein